VSQLDSRSLLGFVIGQDDAVGLEAASDALGDLLLASALLARGEEGLSGRLRS
jgi:hypothetical protein